MNRTNDIFCREPVQFAALKEALAETGFTKVCKSGWPVISVDGDGYDVDICCDGVEFATFLVQIDKRGDRCIAVDVRAEK